jgi:hypothetical protein
MLASTAMVTFGSTLNNVKVFLAKNRVTRKE